MFVEDAMNVYRYVLAGVMAGALCFSAANGSFMQKEPPHKLGEVTLKRQKSQGSQTMPPVIFSHWDHRAKFTCRLCHTDIGFGMQAGSTHIRKTDVTGGKFCGACHDGVSRFGGKIVFAACGENDMKGCGKCHGSKASDREAAYYRLAAAMPQDRNGVGIDWVAAEEKGLIKPIDALEKIVTKRSTMKGSADFVLDTKLAGIPEIIFSHKKHTVWNGCEICHPDIFLGVKKGTTTYTMVEISGGLYCGACHGKVAFSVQDCQKCHLKPVQF
jgi:c(7)-type cytochrome triheme protein